MEPGDIVSLSVPLPFKTEDRHYLDLRIPSPVPQPDERLDIHAVSTVILEPTLSVISDSIDCEWSVYVCNVILK